MNLRNLLSSYVRLLQDWENVGGGREWLPAVHGILHNVRPMRERRLRAHVLNRSRHQLTVTMHQEIRLHHLRSVFTRFRTDGLGKRTTPDSAISST